MEQENIVVDVLNDEMSLLATGIAEIAQMLGLINTNQALSGPDLLLLIDCIKDKIGRKGNLELLPIADDGDLDSASELLSFPQDMVNPPDAQSEARRSYSNEASSAKIWYPALKAAGGFQIPETVFVDFDPMSLYPTLDGEAPGPFPWDALQEACATVGYPAFLRTDLASAKHSGPSAYKVTTPDDLISRVCRTFEDNVMKDVASNVTSFMVREFLNIAGPYVAFGGLPIGREWRVFIVEDAVNCAHFYWPEETFEFRTETLPGNWRELLQELSKPPAGLEVLKDIALRAVRAIGEGNWSVDFAEDCYGTWWLIDMARAERSWHPQHERLQTNDPQPVSETLNRRGQTPFMEVHERDGITHTTLDGTKRFTPIIQGS